MKGRPSKPALWQGGLRARKVQTFSNELESGKESRASDMCHPLTGTCQNHLANFYTIPIMPARFPPFASYPNEIVRVLEDRFVAPVGWKDQLDRHTSFPEDSKHCSLHLHVILHVGVSLVELIERIRNCRGDVNRIWELCESWLLQVCVMLLLFWYNVS